MVNALFIRHKAPCQRRKRVGGMELNDSVSGGRLFKRSNGVTAFATINCLMLCVSGPFMMVQSLEKYVQYKLSGGVGG